MHILRHRFLRLAGLTVLLVACEKSSDSQNDEPFGPGAGFDASSGDSAQPEGDASLPSKDGSATGDAADGSVNEPTAVQTVTGIAGGVLSGAASDDGSAMLLVSSGSSTTVWSHYEPGSGWSASAPLAGGVPSDSRLALDGKGNAFVSWIASTAGVLGLNVLRYDHAMNAWSAVQHPDAYAEMVWYQSAVAANASGEALVVDLRRGTVDAHDLYVQHYAAGAWTQELVVAQASTVSLSGYPVVKLTDTGRAVVTWFADGANHVATRSAGGTWTAAPAALPAGDVINIAINEAGDVLVGMEDSGTSPSAYQYDAAGDTWSGPTTLSAVGQTVLFLDCPLTVGLAKNGDGTLVRCFSGASATRTIESYAFVKSTKTWGAKQPFPSLGWPFSVRFGFDATGDGLAIWTNAPTSSAQSTPAVMSRYSPGAGWSATSAALGAATDRTGTFVSPNGRGFAAWLEGSATKIKKVL